MAVQNISVADCRRLFEHGKTLTILDVRTPAEFGSIHAAGARLAPLGALDPAAIAAVRHDTNEPIYVICQSGGRSAKACEQLAKAGLKNIYNIEGGTVAWEKCGLPVERGTSKVISLERQVRIAAGSLVLIGVALTWFVHPGFLIVPAFIGAGLTFAGITDFCGMGLLLAKMPWNKHGAAACADPAAP